MGIFLRQLSAAVALTVYLLPEASAKCSADNCYRALFPCSLPSALSAASDFCAAINANKTISNYPTRATLACGISPARYVSACQCGPTCTSTPTITNTADPISTATATSAPCSAQTNGLLLNGDFECGTLFWVVTVPDPAAITLVTSSSNTGIKAFEVDFQTPSASPESGVSARITSLSVPIMPGTLYSLKFSTYFDNPDAGFVGVMVNGKPVRTVDARDNGWGAYYENQVTWTPAANVTTAAISFELLFVSGVSSIDRIDSIVFGPA